MTRRERHQLFVDRGNDAFLVTAVRRGDVLRPRPRRESDHRSGPLGLDLGDDLVGAAIGAVVFLAAGAAVIVVDEIARSRPVGWKVGVFAVRRTARRTRWREVHREVLAPAEEPARAVRRLATDVREGRLG